MLDRTKAPAYQTLHSVHLPKAQTYRLDNGLPLHVINVGEQPLVRLECIFKAGTWYEPKRAVAQFTIKMLNEGTSTRTSQQISEYVDQFGAFIEFNHGADKISLTVFSLVKYLPEILILVSDVLQDSVFPVKELDNLKVIKTQALKVNLEKNAYMANAVFRERLFGADHPYGRDLREEDIQLISSNDLKQYYSRYIQNRSYDIVLAGQVSEREIHLLNQYLGQHPITDAEGYKNNGYAFPAVFTPALVEKPDSVQSTIRIGRRLFPRNHPDYTRVLVLNEVLGGYFGSRLMKNIREDKGFTYGISSNLVAYQREGYWIIGTDVKKEATRQTIEETLKEINRLKSELVDEAELETVKNYMAGSFAGSLNTAFDIADRFKILYFEGLPADFYDSYIKRIQAVSAGELLELANQYLDTSVLQEVVVGGK